MKQCVMVVAHPDDETLWGAGLLLSEPGDWTVICCSVPRHDSIRAWKFFDACDVLGVKGRIIPSTETSPDEDLKHLDIIDLSEFDWIVTHNAQGEYGHKHHRHVHRAVTERYSHKKIWTFGHRRIGQGSISIKLSDVQCAQKMKALNRYNHLHPYMGKNIPKWEALLHRYRDVEGINLFTETYDEFRA